MGQNPNNFVVELIEIVSRTWRQTCVTTEWEREKGVNQEGGCATHSDMLVTVVLIAILVYMVP